MPVTSRARTDGCAAHPAASWPTAGGSKWPQGVGPTSREAEQRQRQDDGGRAEAARPGDDEDQPGRSAGEEPSRSPAKTVHPTSAAAKMIPPRRRRFHPPPAGSPAASTQWGRLLTPRLAQPECSRSWLGPRCMRWRRPVPLDGARDDREGRHRRRRDREPHVGAAADATPSRPAPLRSTPRGRAGSPLLRLQLQGVVTVADEPLVLEPPGLAAERQLVPLDPQRAVGAAGNARVRQGAPDVGRLRGAQVAAVALEVV